VSFQVKTWGIYATEFGVANVIQRKLGERAATVPGYAYSSELVAASFFGGHVQKLLTAG